MGVAMGAGHSAAPAPCNIDGAIHIAYLHGGGLGHAVGDGGHGLGGLGLGCGLEGSLGAHHGGGNESSGDSSHCEEVREFGADQATNKRNWWGVGLRAPT